VACGRVVSLLYHLRARHWISSTKCRRVTALAHLEDTETLRALAAGVEDSDAWFALFECCDICERKKGGLWLPLDLGLELALLLEAVYRFGGEHPPDLHVIADILAGSATKAAASVTQFDIHKELVGVGGDHTQSWWQEFMLGPVLDDGWVVWHPTCAGVFNLTPRAMKWRSEHKFVLLMDRKVFTGHFICLANRGMDLADAVKVRAAASTGAAHAKATQTTVTQLLHARDALCRGAHADWSQFDYMPEAAVQAGVRVGFSLLEADAAALSRVSAIHAALDSAYLAENPHDIKFATLIDLLCVNNFPRKCGRLIRRKKTGKTEACGKEAKVQAAGKPLCRSCFNTVRGQVERQAELKRAVAAPAAAYAQRASSALS
jgi:hypothetical protein